MPLDITTKTVLLHDGPFDESDRFLLRAPATDYIENLHFHKDGNLQKRPGNTLLGTAPNASGSPVALHAIGDSLHVLTENGSRTWNGESWAETNVSGFVGTREMAFEAPPAAGMGHLDLFLEYEIGALKRYVLAYEVREESGSDAPKGLPEKRDKHVIVQTYSPSGEFLTQFKIEDAQSPKLTENASSGVDSPVLWFQRVSDNQLLFGSVDASGLVSVAASGLFPSNWFGQESHAIRDEADYGPMVWTRLGASSDNMARYHVAVDTDNAAYLVLYQKQQGYFGGALWLARVTVFRSLSENTQIAAASDAFTYEAFDIVYTGNSECCVLYGSYFSTSPVRVSAATIDKYNSTGTFAASAWSEDVRSDAVPGNTDFYGRTYSHGGLAVRDNGDIAWFVHDAGEAAYDQLEHVRDQNTGLRHGSLTSAGTTKGVDKFLPHHRLASRPVYFEDELYCAVQQWSDMTPYTRNVATYDGYTATTGAAKPRTTVLVYFDQAANVTRPVAYLDAGKSKTSEYAESEWFVHAPHIWIDSGEMVIPNRVVVYPEDLSLNMSDIPGGPFGFPVAARFGAAESPADAMCRVHRVARGARSASAAILGDGLALSTAVPMWFDGRFFGEFGPLDTPEIINVTDTRMSNETPPTRPLLGFDQQLILGPDIARWTKLEVIVGYYDSRGNKHRSAPSSTVWVDNLAGSDPSPDPPEGINATSWRGKDVQVYFTLPLSLLPTDIEYFAELYGSPGDDNDLKLLATTTVSLSTTPKAGDVMIGAQLVRYRGQPDEGVFVRPPRTSRSVYSSGGELEATPWPAFSHSVVTSTRIFALDAINKGKVLVSKRFDDFIAPEYNAQLDINLGDERELTCIAKMDDKTVVFEKDDIHVIYGDGPLNDGRGEDFAVHYISTDVGCQDQESIVECPMGLVFYREERGFYLLDRQLNIRYIGDRVYDIARGIVVKDAQLVSSDGEIRFLCERGSGLYLKHGRAPNTTQRSNRPPRPVYGNVPPVLPFAIVWNYEKDQWTVFTNYPGEVSTIYNGSYTRLLSDWDVWTERSNSDVRYTDPTGDNALLLTTPWIPLAENTQGYSRIYRMNVLGRYLSTFWAFDGGTKYDACDIQVKIWYDYEESPDVTPQTKVFSYRDFGFDPFSADRNIRAERLQFTITPAEGRGRCQAVKLEFKEILPTPWDGESYELGQGFEISSIDFEIGVDPRTTRLLPPAVRK